MDLLARGETRSGCDGPDRSVSAVCNFYTQTQVSACLDALCCGFRTACSNQIIRKIHPGLFSETPNVLQHKVRKIFQTSHLCIEVFPCCVTDNLPGHVLNPFYALVSAFTAVFIFVSLSKHCLIPGSHAMFFFLFQAHKTLGTDLFFFIFP